MVLTIFHEAGYQTGRELKNDALNSSASYSSVDDYPASLQILIEKLQTSRYLSAEQVTSVLKAANVSAEDLMPWADFDHSCRDSYGRKLVFYGGHFEIMVMSWVPGDFSAVHDHGPTQWGAVQCFGYAKHYIYTLKNCVLQNSVAAHYSPGMIHAVNNSLIHQMGNESDCPFLSLHVYGCQDTQPSITGNARVFDLLEGSIQYTDSGVFFCLPDDKINKRQYGIRGDRETTLRQHRLMNSRLRQMVRLRDNRRAKEMLRRLQTRMKTIQ